MANKKCVIGAGDILLVLLSATFLVGMLSFLAPCGPREDGSFMTCHWAGNALAGLAAVLCAVSVAHAVLPDAGAKLGLDVAGVSVAVLALVLPGNLIRLCSMADMRCHAVMRPGASVLAVLIIVAAVVDAVLRTRKKRLGYAGIALP